MIRITGRHELSTAITPVLQLALAATDLDAALQHTLMRLCLVPQTQVEPSDLLSESIKNFQARTVQ